MATPYRFFIFIVIIQLFYAFGITVLSHGISGLSVNQDFLTPYQEKVTNTSQISSKIESTTENVIKMPFGSLGNTGALVFYTGNIILDLILNFFTAIPSLVTLLVGGFMSFFSIEPVYAMQINIILFLLVTIIYILQLIAFIMQLRGQGGKIT